MEFTAPILKRLAQIAPDRVTAAKVRGQAASDPVTRFPAGSMRRLQGARIFSRQQKGLADAK
jgi:hypothetical protein